MLLTEITDALSLNLLYANSEISSTPTVALQPFINQHEYYLLPMIYNDSIAEDPDDEIPVNRTYLLSVTLLGLIIGFSLLSKR